MRSFYFLVLLFVLLNSAEDLTGQSLDIESYSFGVRANDPVKVSYTNDQDKFSFTAHNASYFQYLLTIKFSTLQNLSPYLIERKFVLSHGNNKLFDLTILNKSQTIQFDYRISYSINLANDPDVSFPYLIPVGKGRIVQLRSFMNNETKTLLLNYFDVKSGDTVFAVRKGIITALPEDETRVDRIRLRTLEVLHGDGTLAMYSGLKCGLFKLFQGQTVFPGQPIGIVDENELLKLNILAMNDPNSLKSLDIYYSDQNARQVSSEGINNLKVFYPKEIIEKELSTREVKKYKTGKLY